MDEVKVSVIVPIYNTEIELPRCVQSIQQQTFSDIEIILVDDGSTDFCPQMCDTYAGQDRRIRVLHKKNGGLSDARNTGLLAAKGQYILYVDSDDFIEKDAIAQLLRGAVPGVDLIAGAIKEWEDNQQTIFRRVGLEDGKIYTAKEFVISSIQNNIFMVMAWSYMYRREYLINNQLFYTKGRYFEDLDLALDLFLHASGIINIDFPFYNYVKREGSITKSDNSRKKILDNVSALKRWKEILDNIEDTELKKYLYTKLINVYFNMCDARKLIGWWIPGLNFPVALIRGFGQRMDVIRFELNTLYYKCFSPNDPLHRLPDREIIKEL